MTIPISEAKRLTQTYGLQGVVIIGFDFTDDDHGTKLATYGFNEIMCQAISDVGGQIVHKIMTCEIQPRMEGLEK